MPAVSFFVGGLQPRNCPGRRTCVVWCSSGLSKAAAEIADAPRRRRVRRRDRKIGKDSESIDLEKDVQPVLLAEEAKWSGPSPDELLGQMPHPLLGGVLESVFAQAMSFNAGCNSLMKKVFEDEFPTSSTVIDYIEFRLLEVDGKGVAQLLEFFLNFDYKETASSVMTHKTKPIHCTVLLPPPYQKLPKIVLSHLKVDVDLSDACKDVIRKRMEDWLPLADKYASTALGVTGAPWSFPTKPEYELIARESDFAAWCMIHGYSAASIAVSVNEMRKANYKYTANPNLITLEKINSVLQDSYPMNPLCETPIWTAAEGFPKALAPVAEVMPLTLCDGNTVDVPGSHISFVERTILPEFEGLKNEDGFIAYEQEHLNQEIDQRFLTYMHGCIDTAIVVAAQAEDVHQQVIEKARSEGKVLTLDGSNEEDEELYKQYFEEILKNTASVGNMAQ